MATQHQIGPHLTAEQAVDVMWDLIVTNLKFTGLEYEALKKHCYQKAKTEITVADLIKKKAESDAS